MIQESTNNPLFYAWPFWMLELDPSANTQAVERNYNRISNLLTLQAPDAERFATPAGLRNRDEFSLREARAILNDPERRLLAEFWYLDPANSNNNQDDTGTAQDWNALLKV